MQITGPCPRLAELVYLASLMGGGTWNQNFDTVQSWILTYTKARELRWGILPVPALSGSIAEIIPQSFQVFLESTFSFPSNNLKEEAESYLGSFYRERKKWIKKVQWLAFPTQQVLTFHCALKEVAFLPPKLYFQGCLLAVCYLKIKVILSSHFSKICNNYKLTL